MKGFEWDPEKNIANRRKHGLSFDEAALIFDGPVLTAPDHSTGEVRDKSFGLLGGMVVVCVVHTERSGRIRIISARKATASERKQFDVHLKKALG